MSTTGWVTFGWPKHPGGAVTSSPSEQWALKQLEWVVHYEGAGPGSYWVKDEQGTVLHSFRVDWRGTAYTPQGDVILTGIPVSVLTVTQPSEGEYSAVVTLNAEHPVKHHFTATTSEDAVNAAQRLLRFYLASVVTVHQWQRGIQTPSNKLYWEGQELVCQSLDTGRVATLFTAPEPWRIPLTPPTCVDAPDQAFADLLHELAGRESPHLAF